MKKKTMVSSILFLVILVVLIVNMSFAWYTAKVNQGVIELTSESIEININDQSDELKPDILKEGVLTIVDGEVSLPNDYQTNEDYYLQRKTTVTFIQDIMVNLDQSNKLVLNLEICYMSKGKLVKLSPEDLIKYFDINYSLISSGEHLMKEYNGPADIGLDKEIKSYTLKLEISYKLPDELLPSELVSSNLLLIISGSLA